MLDGCIIIEKCRLHQTSLSQSQHFRVFSNANKGKIRYTLENRLLSHEIVGNRELFFSESGNTCTQEGSSV